MKQLPRIYKGLAMILVGGFTIHRCWLALKNTHPVGWDGGMYRDYFRIYQSNLPNIDITQLPEYIGGFPPFLGIIGSLLSLFGISTDMILTFGPTGMVILIGCAVYSLLKSYNQKTALVGGLFVAFSPVIFWLAWSGFMKQLVAIFFMVCVLKTIAHKKYLIGSILFISLLFLHRPTGLLVSIVLILLALLMIRKKGVHALWWMICGSGLVVFCMYLPILDKMIPDFFQKETQELFLNKYGGTFFARSDFWLLQIPALLIAGVSGFTYVQGRKLGTPIKANQAPMVFWIGCIISLLWSVLGFAFHNRMLTFIEIFFILLLSIITIPILMKQRWGKVFISIVLMLQMSLGAFVAHTHSEPRISPSEMEFIQLTTKTLPQDTYIINPDRMYATWLMGYTNHSRNIIAPHIGQHWDDWDTRRWHDWNAVDGYLKCKLLKKKYTHGYPNLYLFVGARTSLKVNLSGGYCFKKVGQDNFSFLYKVGYR